MAKPVPLQPATPISSFLVALHRAAWRRGARRKLATCLVVPHFDGAPPHNPNRRGPVGQPRALERAKSFFFAHFERMFVVLLFASMLVIHYFVDEKLAFLSFYYLPIILAGFYGGRRFAVMSGVFLVSLVFFFQGVFGLELQPGFYLGALLTLVPWGGFLILVGYVVGILAEDRARRLTDIKNAYLAVL